MNGSDWQNIMLAVQAWLVGGNPYAPFITVQGTLSPPGYFAYPPGLLYLLIIFTYMPTWLSALLVIILTWLGWEWWVRRVWGRVALFTLLWWPLIDHLTFGQTTLPLLLLLCVVWLSWDKPGVTYWSAPLLAIVTLKPQIAALPLVVILYRGFFERRWYMLANIVFWIILIWAIPLIVGGTELYQTWFAEAFRHVGLRTMVWSYWSTGLLGIVLVAVYWWRVETPDPLYTAIGLTTLLIPLGNIYSVVGLLIPLLAARKRLVAIVPLGITLLSILNLQLSYEALRFHLILALAGCIGVLLVPQNVTLPPSLKRNRIFVLPWHK